MQLKDRYFFRMLYLPKTKDSVQDYQDIKATAAKLSKTVWEYVLSLHRKYISEIVEVKETKCDKGESW